mmetsp:Transcript_33037/g.48516  ORF Transcript_33037/g.48516 Transcript_33037/m.48516 type:complete len:92 (+) Transcript_33037:52-327(+)
MISSQVSFFVLSLCLAIHVYREDHPRVVIHRTAQQQQQQQHAAIHEIFRLYCAILKKHANQITHTHAHTHSKKRRDLNHRIIQKKKKYGCS